MLLLVLCGLEVPWYLPYLGSRSLQTMIKLKKSLKKIINCWKMQIVFKNKTRLRNKFYLEDLTSGVVWAPSTLVSPVPWFKILTNYDQVKEIIEKNH